MKKQISLEKQIGKHTLLFGETLRPVVAHSRCYYESVSVAKRAAFLRSTGLFNEERGNDAPRGGKLGNFIRFTPKAIDAQAQAEYNERRQAKKKARQAVKSLREQLQREEEDRQKALAAEWASHTDNLIRYNRYEREKATGNSHQRSCTAAWKLSGKVGINPSSLRHAVEAELQRRTGWIHGRIQAVNA